MDQFRVLSILLLVSFFSPSIFAQIAGGNPPSVKWSQINTPSVRIVFPNGLDSIANRVANVISFIHKPTQKTVGNKTRKINIVFQNQTAVSNGYVGMAPFKSEFYLSAPQNSFDLGSIPWPDMLALHEYRHVEQYSNFDVGISRVMKVLFGDGGQALANSAAIPDWFFEGDAVFNETKLSKQGRGTLPSFFDGYKALWQAGKNYNWMQLRNGSLRKYIPDHYILGYMLVAYGREKYGDDFWKEVTQDAAAYKNLIYPFQKAIKRHSGLSYKDFRNDALNYFKSHLQIEDKKVLKKSDPEEYSNEQYPVFTKEGDIIFLKNSFDEIPAFFIREKDGSDKKIRVTDYSIDPYFSYSNGKIAYVNNRPDLRWGNLDYNEIKVLSLGSGKQKTITKKSRYFSPDISEDGKFVVAVAEDNFTRQTLQLIDIETEEVKKLVLNKEGLIYTYPKFINENKVVTSVRNREGQMSIAEINFSENKTTYLLPFSFNVIGFPVVYRDTLYFSYSYLKKDELFAYSFADKKFWEIEVPGVGGEGKYAPTLNDHHIAWHTLTSEGNKIISVPREQLLFIEISVNQFRQKTFDFGISSLNETNDKLLYKVPDDSFKVSKYRKGFQLFNFHSLIPDISHPDYTITLAGENILGTFQSELSLTYNQTERYKRIGFSGTYSALFPFLTGGVNFTLDRRSFLNGNPVYFNQLEPFAGINVPLNLSRGRSFTSLNIGSRYVFNKSFFKGVYKDSLADRHYGYLNNYFSVSHQVQKAAKQIFPRFAQTVNASYKAALSNYRGNQAVINASFYLPGLFKNNSLVLNGAWLRKDSLRQINFSSAFPFSRGYEGANFYRMYKLGINYHFPLLYPDAGFGNILYVLRVRGNVFLDNTTVHDFKQSRESFSANFRSAGTEINFDTKWWNQVKVSFGFRYSYLLDKDLYGQSGPHRWEMILPVNIFNQ